MRKYDVSKAVSALGARGLVPGHRNKTALRSLALQKPKYHIVPEYSVETLYPGKGSVHEFWCDYLERGCSH